VWIDSDNKLWLLNRFKLKKIVFKELKKHIWPTTKKKGFSPKDLWKIKLSKDLIPAKYVIRKVGFSTRLEGQNTIFSNYPRNIRRNSKPNSSECPLSPEIVQFITKGSLESNFIDNNIYEIYNVFNCKIKFHNFISKIYFSPPKKNVIKANWFAY